MLRPKPRYGTPSTPSDPVAGTEGLLPPPQEPHPALDLHLFGLGPWNEKSWARPWYRPPIMTKRNGQLDTAK